MNAWGAGCWVASRSRLGLGCSQAGLVQLLQCAQQNALLLGKLLVVCTPCVSRACLEARNRLRQTFLHLKAFEKLHELRLVPEQNLRDRPRLLRVGHKNLEDVKGLELDGFGGAAEQVHHDLEVLRLVDVSHHDLEVRAIQQELAQKLKTCSESCTQDQELAAQAGLGKEAPTLSD